MQAVFTIDHIVSECTYKNLTSQFWGIADAIKRVDEGNYWRNVKHIKKSFVDARGVERVAELIELHVAMCCFIFLFAS